MQEIELTEIVAYVLSLRKEGGGFGATRRLPATVEDTFQAVAILRLLAERTGLAAPLADCRADAGLRAYIGRLWPGRHLDPKTVQQLFATNQALGLAFDPIAITELAVAHLIRSPSLLTAYYAALVAGRPVAVVLRDRLGSDWSTALLPKRATSEELMMWLRLRHAVGLAPAAGRRDELSGWFRDCQAGDGGFGFLPGTTSFMENCHFCLQALAILGAEPQDAAGAAAFILSSQTRRGSFGRRAKAAPFLDATYHAMMALGLLGYLCGSPKSLPAGKRKNAA